MTKPMSKITARLPLVVLSVGALAAIGGSGAIAAPAATAATAATAAPAATAAVAHVGPPGLDLPGTGRVPKPGASSQLNNVYCVTSADCWAVGAYAPSHQGSRNQVLHWTGQAWHSVSVPNPGTGAGSFQSDLSGIRCTGRTNCWAVGSYTGKKDTLNEALHFNGTRWTKVSTPEPTGTKPGDVNQLYDVTCVSSSACWAAGEYGPQGTAQNEVLRWNGKAWSRMKTPQPGGTSDGNVNDLSGLTCASPTSCWASGTDGTVAPPDVVLVNEVLHWNGTKWLLANVPDPDGTSNGSSNQLYGDFCANASDCWAVGEVGTGTNSALTEALHWNGTTWTTVTTPNPGGTTSNAYNDLVAVRCTRPSDCWAVGTANAPSAPTKNMLLQWNGASWADH